MLDYSEIIAMGFILFILLEKNHCCIIPSFRNYQPEISPKKARIWFLAFPSGFTPCKAPALSSPPFPSGPQIGSVKKPGELILLVSDKESNYTP
jgi:hypothetical protein